MQDEIIKRHRKLISVLGKIIKNYRIKQGKTIYAISAEASMSKSTWREVEEGICNDIKLSTIWKIAEGLDISVSVLMNELSSELGESFSLSDID
ncbi:MAG: helix-turn-helix transcriptional regulator [bacterium]|nr:helix-turn-helix transcriptional regulator [bacterium]